MSVFQTDIFFYVSPEVAWLPHGIGFVFGLSAAMLLLRVFRLPEKQIDGLAWHYEPTAFEEWKLR
jgi:hypothetical protein